MRAEHDERPARASHTARATEASRSGGKRARTWLRRLRSELWSWLPLAGAAAFLAGCKGRPLWVRGRAHVAPAVPREEWGAELGPSVAGLDETLRRELARRWLADAGEEHASVAAFSRLSLELMALGAPPQLLEAAHRAALDEVRHARLCYSMASGYAGQSLGPDALPEALAAAHEAARPTLDRLAVDSLRDGCLYEGFAAAVAGASAKLAADETVGRVLQGIARDEERHAELGWSVIGWCLERGGAEVREAVQRAWRQLPRELPAEPRDDDGLAEHGWLSGGTRRALFETTRRQLDRKLAERLVAAQAAQAA